MEWRAVDGRGQKEEEEEVPKTFRTLKFQEANQVRLLEKVKFEKKNSECGYRKTALLFVV